MNKQRHKDNGNSELLRRDIDGVRTSDKINYSDPAAQQLGADDKTVGFPPTRSNLELLRALEMRPAEPTERGDEGLPSFGRLIVIALAMFAIVALLINYTLP